jgi:hypothetical protein
MLERQQQTADIEAQRNGAGGDPEDDDDDEGFILDPSVLTVQDMMVSQSVSPLILHKPHLINSVNTPLITTYPLFPFI